jgi:hypothetical protein
VTVMSLPGPEAARRAGLEMVEKSLTGALWPLPCEIKNGVSGAPGHKGWSRSTPGFNCPR